MAIYGEEDWTALSAKHKEDAEDAAPAAGSPDGPRATSSRPAHEPGRARAAGRGGAPPSSPIPGCAGRSISAPSLYLVLALGSMNVNWARLAEGLSRGGRFVQGFPAPQLLVARRRHHDRPAGKHHHDGVRHRRRHRPVDPGRHRRGAQHRSPSRLFSLPRYRRRHALVPGDPVRHLLRRHVRFRHLRRLPHHYVRHHRLPRQAAGRGHRGYRRRRRPRRCAPRGPAGGRCSTTASSPRSCRG